MNQHVNRPQGERSQGTAKGLQEPQLGCKEILFKIKWERSQGRDHTKSDSAS